MLPVALGNGRVLRVLVLRKLSLMCLIAGKEWIVVSEGVGFCSSPTGCERLACSAMRLGPSHGAGLDYDGLAYTCVSREVDGFECVEEVYPSDLIAEQV